MASIPDVDIKPPSASQTEEKTETPNVETKNEISTEPQISIEQTDQTTTETPSTSQSNQTENESQAASGQDEHDKPSGVKACDDVRYRKYFKMLLFGVPKPAVKLKMANEGCDPNILE